MSCDSLNWLEHSKLLCCRYIYIYISRDAPSPRNDAKHVLILVVLILHLGRSFASRYISILWYVADVGKGVIQQNEYAHIAQWGHTHTHVYIYIQYIFHKSISFFNQPCRTRLNKPSNLFSPKKTTKNPHADLDQLAPPLDPPTRIACKDKAEDLKVTLRPYIPHRTQAPVSCCVLFLECFFFWKDGGDVSSYSLDYQIMIDHNE